MNNKLDKLKIDKKVAIFNFVYLSNNYGAVLVAYSMEVLIRSLGFEPITINLYSPAVLRINPFLVKFKNEYLHLTSKKYRFLSNLVTLNKYFNTFVVGSDQVWNNYSSEYVYFLSFADERKKLIAFSTSFGKDEFQASEETIQTIKFLLSAFSDISVREYDGVKICKDVFNVHAEKVLDPTILISTSNYEQIIDAEKDSITIPKNKYLVKMFFKEKEENKKIDDFVDEFGNNADLEICDIFEKYHSVGEWLALIKNANYIITNSFHAVMFSIIWRKPFYCFSRPPFTSSRFDSILQSAGLEDRLLDVNKLPELSTLIEKKIDYEKVYEKLKPQIQFSREFLRNALNKEVKLNSKVAYYNVTRFYFYHICKMFIKEKVLLLKDFIRDVINTFLRRN